ncbi:phosphoglucomutase/phosphomannomutase, alpha/beta/alpha domain I family protein, partial [Vibrio parahaemolyticus V-223/04]
SLVQCRHQLSLT